MEVDLDPKVTIAGFESVAKLPNLRRFFFGDCNRDETLQLHLRCLPLCAQHMPKLEQVGEDFSGLYYESILDEGNVGTFYHNRMLHEPRRLFIEQLVLSGEVTVHDGCQLPQLKELHLLCPTSSIVGHFTDGRFSAISHIGFYTSAVDTTMEVLKIVGWRLRSLVIKEAPLHLSLLSILQNCPQLEKFELYACVLSNSDDFWKENLFSCLEEIRMIFHEPDALPTGFIKMVNEYD